MSPRRRPAERWPWPEDTGLERREKIARSYRDALRQVAPEDAERLDAMAAAVGQTWVLTTRRQLPDDELLDTAAVAEHFDVDVRIVDQWRYRDGLSAQHTPDGVRYRYADVVQFLADRRRARRTRVPRLAGDTPPGTHRDGPMRNV